MQPSILCAFLRKDDAQGQQLRIAAHRPHQLQSAQWAVGANHRQRHYRKASHADGCGVPKDAGPSLRVICASGEQGYRRAGKQKIVESSRRARR